LIPFDHFRSLSITWPQALSSKLLSAQGEVAGLHLEVERRNHQVSSAKDAAARAEAALEETKAALPCQLAALEGQVRS
jgi:outer membrane murein-binding lipoprotein Lpp